MRLESARELKVNLIALVRSASRAGAVRASERLGVVSRGARPTASVPSRQGVAFGVAPMPGDARQFRLAVRVMGRSAGWARRILARIPGLGERELDFAQGVQYAPRAGRTAPAHRPVKVLRAGGSCGHPNITAGTLGGFVEDSRRYYALSNNHVFADCDAASVGDPIWQPGPYDARSGAHVVIAHLSRWVELDPSRTDVVDAAIAELDGEVPEFLPWDYAGIGEVVPRPIEDRYAVRRVVKRGRTTGVTRGRVSAFELDGVRLDYGTRLEPRLITFDDQIECVHQRSTRAFSQGGDSGSLILDAATLRPYALLYGGGADADGIDRTLAHFLPPVLQRLRVRMVQP